MTVAFTDTRVHPASKAFYTTFPWEPARTAADIKVDRVFDTHLKMEWLLEQLPGAVGPGGNLFIIYHGTERGLSMPLATGSPVNDAQVREVLDGGSSDVEAAQICLVHDPQRNGAQRVHALREPVRMCAIRFAISSE